MVKNGVIYTIAGNGFAGNGLSGYTGDGGPATSAELAGLWGIAVDGVGKVYFTDQARFNAVIRQLTPSGNYTYYFPHFAVGGGWQTVLTYVNYSQQAVTCQTNFVFDDGTPLAVPFGGPASPTRLDTLATRPQPTLCSLQIRLPL